MKIFKLLLTLSIVSIVSFNLDAASQEPRKRKDEKEHRPLSKRSRGERCSGCTREIQQGALTIIADCCKTIIHDDVDCLGKHQMCCAAAIAALGSFAAGEALYADAFSGRKKKRNEDKPLLPISEAKAEQKEDVIEIDTQDFKKPKIKKSKKIKKHNGLLKRNHCLKQRLQMILLVVF